MAKKKVKSFKIEQNELKSLTIGSFENKKRSSISVFVLLTFFILLVFFLPNITEFINGYLNPEPITPNTGGNNNPVIKPGEDGDNYNEVFYDLAADLKIDREDIRLSDFVLDPTTNTLTFSITNISNNHLKVEDLNYYLELYNSEHTLLERVKLTGDKTLVSGAYNNYTKILSSDISPILSALTLVKKSHNDYPALELEKNSEGIGTLICNNNQQKVTYRFKDNLLKEILSEVNYKNTDVDYLTYYEDNKILSDNYNNREGVTSTFFEYTEGYNITTNINLEDATRFYVYGADSFNLDTEAKVVNFEMEAQGFSCN